MMHQQTQLEMDGLLASTSLRGVEAEHQLFALAYGSLKSIASVLLSRRSGASVDDAQALVHETYLRMPRREAIHWNDSRHFFALSARTMRRVLIDQARAKLAEKRGSDAGVVTFREELHSAWDAGRMSEDLRECIELLKREAPRIGLVVHLRFFDGLTEEEIAVRLGVSARTVKRYWRSALRWFRANWDLEPNFRGD